MLRWVLGGIGCLIAGVIFLVQYSSGVPSLDQLTTVTGVVNSAEVETRRSRRSTSQVLVVRIDDKPAASYRDRFPDFERIVMAVRPGDRVTAWVDVGKNDYIWQLEKDGERLVVYWQVAAAQRSNDRMRFLLALVFIATGFSILGVMAWQWKKAQAATSQTEPEQPQSAE